MRLEHLFFNLAVAIVAGMVYQRMTGRDPTVIILLAAFLPDLDVPVHIGVHVLERISGISILFYHGSFHNILALAVISLGVAFFASRYGIRFLDAAICTAIGYGTHLVCDAVAFNEVPYLLWPLGPAEIGVAPHTYIPDLFGIAQGSVLAAGVVCVLLAALVRTLVEGRGWVRNYTHPDLTRT